MSILITGRVIRFAVGSRIVRLTLDDKNVFMMRALNARHAQDGEIVVQTGDPGCRKIWFAPISPVVAAIDDYYAWIAARVEQARIESESVSETQCAVDCRRRRSQSQTVRSQLVVATRDHGNSESSLCMGR